MFTFFKWKIYIIYNMSAIFGHSHLLITGNLHSMVIGGNITCQEGFLYGFYLDSAVFSILCIILYLSLINIACFAYSRRDSWPVPRWWSGEHHWQCETWGPCLRIDGYKRKLLEVLHRPGSETAQGETLWDYYIREVFLSFFPGISQLIVQRKVVLNDCP